MTTTQKYQGQDLGELLERVRVEHGSDAPIVGANRCRSGGIAGFFAVESFEVMVEVPGSWSQPTTKRPARRVDRPPTPLGGTDVQDTSGPAIGRRGSRRVRARPSRAGGTLATSAGSEPSPALAALVAAADEAEIAESHPRRDRTAASTDDFSSFLDRAVAPPARNGRFGRWLDVPVGQGASADQSTVRAPRRVLGRRTRIDRKRSSTRSFETAGSVERVVDIVALEDAGLVPSRAALISDVGAKRPGAMRSDEVFTAELAELGVPKRWLFPDVDGRASLRTVLGNLTPPPTMITTPGTMIAVIGELGLVVDVGRAISVALRQDPTTCVLLSTASRPEGFRGELVNVIDELADRREHWARRSTVTVVAVDIGFARHDIAWGRLAVSSLRPTMRWGAVSATRKAEDVSIWARSIGGLHALAVTGMSETATPAGILDAGVPVGRIDGQVASPDLWLRLLNDRLGEVSRIPDLVAN